MKNLGITEELIQESKKYEDLFIGRVSSQSKRIYKVVTKKGMMIAEVSGKYHHDVTEASEYPAVGDFVMIDRIDDTQGNGIIHHVLPRKSMFVRKTAGNTEKSQIVATNIDTVFICMSLNEDYNLRRLERYLSIAWDSNATPVIVLTKSDLCDDIDSKLTEIYSIAIGVDVLVTTSTYEEGYQSLVHYLSKGQSVAFIGSSGVGKSTLINRLIGRDVLETKEIRNDDKGRHTTTSRELFMLPDLGVVIDTPGMRELGIIQADLTKTFSDIDELAKDCKFNDCTHKHEPNCAVRKAINEGLLTKERLENYWKLEKEAKYDSLDSRRIEIEKIADMFGSLSDMKNFRKFNKAKNKKRKDNF